MSPTGLPLLILLAILAVGLPVLLGITWRRLPVRALGVLTRVGAVLVCQVLAIALVGVAINQQFGFYNSWGELLGRSTTSPVQLTAQGELVPADGSQGRMTYLDVDGRVSGVSQQVLVWLPPEYDRSPDTTFPVLMALHGTPGSTVGIFDQFDLAVNAIRAVEAGHVKPFVIVLPPLNIAPPRELECTDVPGGPKADSWLSVDVPEAVKQHFRVTKSGWSTTGFSTGGFCAAKMLLRHPGTFGGAAPIGGYFDAVEDSTTGNLFGNDPDLRDQNSPLWLLKHVHKFPVHLLIVTSKADSESWSGAPYANAEEAVHAGTGVLGFAAIVLPTGGHNPSTYGPTIEPAFAWLGQHAGL